MLTEHTIRADTNHATVLTGTALTKTYQLGMEVVRAVQDVSVGLKEAEILAVLGPSGCGKSSLLQLLSGIESPDRGDVSYLGQSLTEMTEQQMATLRSEDFGFVLQQGNLVPSLTLLENVSLPLLCSGTKTKDAQKRAMLMMERVGIAHRSGSFPAEVSGGEAQRAAIVRSCICQQRVIFADEPTGALDSASAQEVLRIFQEIVADFGASIVLVTHDMETADIATRTLVMRDGGVVDEY